MNLRKSCLPLGWYPRDPSKIKDFLQEFAEKGQPGVNGLLAAVAPHAGWYYSGAVAAQAVAALSAGASNKNSGSPNTGNFAASTVVVIGGHLPEGMPALFAMEDAAETPLGAMEIDNELRASLLTGFREIPGFRAAEDRYQDNTVEVLLPMAAYFFPGAKLLWLRLPADIRSFEAGKILARVSPEKKLLVLGSTDLTHYGANYGFSPKGSGKEALSWVTTVNDRRFIDAVEAGDPEAALQRAEEERSACSAGAVLGVMGYAAERRAAGGSGNSAGKLLEYGTSAEIAMQDEGIMPDSFVGYAAIGF